MYSHFVQFTIPKIGQALVAVLLYLNFLQLPFVAILPEPCPGLLRPAAGADRSGDVCRPRSAERGHGVGRGAYRRVRGLRPAGLIFRLIGGPAYAVWRLVYCGGLLAWGITLAWLVYGWRRAKRLCTTTYRVRTAKPLPGGRLRVVQISDLHAGSTMDAARADELAGRVAALDPDLLVFTGDIYDETTPRAAFDAYNRAFARMPARYGKFFIFGNHDLGEYFANSSFTRTDLETALAAADIRVLEDVAVPVYTGGGVLRVVGRKDWLYCEHRRFSPAS